MHVCYCHAPFRYAWYEEARALSEAPRVARPALRGLLAALRRWDLATSRRVDRPSPLTSRPRNGFVATTGATPRSIHPPGGHGTASRGRGEPGEQLLTVRRSSATSACTWRLEAARRAGAPIRVAGSGPDSRARWRRVPGGRVPGARSTTAQLEELLRRARAVIVASMEEFGMTAVEAQAAGRPVIAAAAGGALEIGALDGTTGRPGGA